MGTLFLRWLGRLSLWPIFRLAFRVDVRGTDRVPLDGPLLVVSNHLSFADPPLVWYSLPRFAEFMAAEEIFKIWWLGWYIRLNRAFPVNRAKPGTSAIREAIRRLEAGRCVAIFPEGGIRRGDQSLLAGKADIKAGVATIAMSHHTAILPVIIRNTSIVLDWRNWFRGHRLPVTLGYSFCLWIPPDVPNGERREAVTATLRAELLKTVELRG